MSVWKVRSQDELPSDINDLALDLSISPFLASILYKRGHKTPEDMDRFLSPGLRFLPKPETIPGLEQAAEVLARIVEQGKKLVIWGDYDVDGVTSTALVLDFLAQKGFSASYHLPNRLTHGYGMNVDMVEKLHDDGAQAILTVDCGISDHAPVARARELGMDVVVSDHHLPGDSLPEAHAVCDPRIGECGLGHLAGVGVAFMLMAKFNRMNGQPLDMRQFLDLVALGTISDVVSLTGVNRVLVKNGLLLIKEAPRPGIAALKAVSGTNMDAEMGAGQVGFNLGPRINAAGRLGSPVRALELLLAHDLDQARPIAAELDALNKERRQQEESMLAAAQDQAREEVRRNRLGLVLYGENWHSGVIGIVASRIVEKFHRPTIILCKENGVVKGSGRSVDGFHLHQGLTSISELFLRFGGHKLAAGFSMEPGRLPELGDMFDQAVKKVATKDDLKPVLKYDAELDLLDINAALLRELEMLQPTGIGNPSPVFVKKGLDVRNFKVFGKQHVLIEVQDPGSGVCLRAKAWRMADSMSSSAVKPGIDLAFSPKLDTYNAIPSIELVVKDWKASPFL